MLDIKYSEKAVKQINKIRTGTDRGDYYSALAVKRKNKKWVSHRELKKSLRI